jgi:hypothetical protein
MGAILSIISIFAWGFGAGVGESLSALPLSFSALFGSKLSLLWSAPALERSLLWSAPALERNLLWSAAALERACSGA